MASLPYEWQCPVCKHRVQTIRLSEPPLCGNPQVHSTKRVPMDKIRGGKLAKEK